MVLRKVLSSYLACGAVILYFWYLFAISPGSSVYVVQELLSWLPLISLYAIPVVFVYGTLVSLTLDFVLARLTLSRWVQLLLSAALHMLMGAVFGLFFQLVPLAIAGSLTALLYWGTDLLLKQAEWTKHRKKWLTGILLLPIVAGVLLMTLAMAGSQINLAS
ncbi:hypothetical protein ACX93W_23245 [Paenibacillus sp. CAU 1782]